MLVLPVLSSFSWSFSYVSHRLFLVPMNSMFAFSYLLGSAGFPGDLITFLILPILLIPVRTGVPLHHLVDGLKD